MISYSDPRTVCTFIYEREARLEHAAAWRVGAGVTSGVESNRLFSRELRHCDAASVCLEEDEDERQAVHLSLLAAPLLMKQRHLLLWFPLMSAI